MARIPNTIVLFDMDGTLTKPRNVHLTRFSSLPCYPFKRPRYFQNNASGGIKTKKRQRQWWRWDGKLAETHPHMIHLPLAACMPHRKLLSRIHLMSRNTRTLQATQLNINFLCLGRYWGNAPVSQETKRAGCYWHGWWVWLVENPRTNGQRRFVIVFLFCASSSLFLKAHSWVSQFLFFLRSGAQFWLCVFWKWFNGVQGWEIIQDSSMLIWNWVCALVFM